MDVVAQVRADFLPIADRVLGVMVFGSAATGRTTPRSDIDICLVGGPAKRPLDTLRLAWTEARLGGAPYDIKAFEELPLYLKAEVLEHGIVALARDEPALGEYLLPWRRIWADQAARNRPDSQEIHRIMAIRRQERR